MDLKKAPRVKLEYRRFTNFIIGMIITLSFVLISFEWTSPDDVDTGLTAATEIDIDIVVMKAIPRDEPKPKPKENLPVVKDVIDIVPDDVEIEDVDFSNEVTKNITYDFRIDDNDPVEVVNEDPIPFINVEDKPLFNGGDPNLEFAKYIARHLTYPEIAAQNGVYGRVFVQFVIDENGMLVNPVILRKVDPALDAEALRVLSTSPRWTPGKQRNRPVKVSYVFPINFTLK
jgi:protein TonB